jgi:hypothetical protein
MEVDVVWPRAGANATYVGSEEAVRSRTPRQQQPLQVLLGLGSIALPSLPPALAA